MNCSSRPKKLSGVLFLILAAQLTLTSCGGSVPSGPVTSNTAIDPAAVGTPATADSYSAPQSVALHEIVPDVAPAATSFMGLATYYGGYRHPRRTASGALFDEHALTAAHRWLPFGTRIRIFDLASGREVIATVNDRGPFGRNRMVDLSTAAAETLGARSRGVFLVKMTVLSDEPEQPLSSSSPLRLLASRTSNRT